MIDFIAFYVILVFMNYLLKNSSNNLILKKTGIFIYLSLGCLILLINQSIYSKEKPNKKEIIELLIGIFSPILIYCFNL